MLPKGVSVAPCIYLMHRRPEIYPDPGAFRPERFLDSPPGTYTWIPFGGGVRRCLGAQFAQMEMKTVLATILRNTKLEPTRAKPERMARRAITFVPDRGGRVVLTAS
jgi:cytochrome P450